VVPNVAGVPAVSLLAFVSAVAALLVAPGPTNALMTVAGAQGGLGRAARLIPAELAGYCTAVLPLVCLGGSVVEQWPALASTLKIVAAAWVMRVALRLWRRRLARDPVVVSRRMIYVTTLLNPKALVFGLALLPSPGDPSFVLKLELFCLMVVGAGLAWGAAGTLTRRGEGGGAGLTTIQRVASVWLALVSATLIAAAIRA
jgi:threonine/homoserine/homoserine lactone efflux protein